MTDQKIYEESARRLRDAYGGAVLQPLREALAPDDVDGAYQVQNINTRFWVDQGRHIVGRKVGLTAKAVQVQLGVDQPDFGILFDDMQVENGGTLPTHKLIQPKAEAEIAFILSADVPDADVTPEQLAKAIAAIAPAIEIVDSRIADWKISFADTVADNGSSAYFVIGEQIPYEGADLWTCGMVMQVNDDVVSLGAGAACLGHPLNAATWLAQTLAARGDPLRKGDVILTGALGPMAPIKAGDHVRATIGGIGEVSFTCQEERP